MVSVSRSARPPHFGHRVFTHFKTAERGDSPESVGLEFLTNGNFTGNDFSGIGTTPGVRIAPEIASSNSSGNSTVPISLKVKWPLFENLRTVFTLRAFS